MWNLLAMGSSYQRGLEEGMKTGFSAVQLFQTAQTAVHEEQLNDAKYQGSILGWARRNYDGRVKGFTVFNPNNFRHPQGKKVCIPPLEVCIPPPTLLHNFHILSLTRSKQSSCKRVTSETDQECTHQEPRGKYRNSSARSRHIPEAASVQLQDLALLMGITH